MSAKIIGLISGLLVFGSIIPYAIRVYQKKIRPSMTSYSLWSLIALALLLTYKSSGAKENIWPAVCSFIRPLIVTFLLLLQHSNWKKPNRLEILCTLICLASLTLWLIVGKNRELSQYALYLAIVADACAALPMIMLVWKDPARDRPLTWVIFALGYGLGILAITEYTLANYVLPIYMLLICLIIIVPLVIYRWQHKSRLSEWI